MTEAGAARGLSDAVRLVVELQLGRPTVELTDRLAEDLNADSFSLMNIVVVLEENLSVRITEEAAASVHTVGDLVALVTALVES
jgi:acyl carrier protein